MTVHTVPSSRHDPVELIAAALEVSIEQWCATLIPPPRAHLTRYHGVFPPNHHLRAAIIPAATVDETGRKPCHRFDWAALKERVFAVDVFACDVCGGTMHILAPLDRGRSDQLLCTDDHPDRIDENIVYFRPAGRGAGQRTS